MGLGSAVIWCIAGYAAFFALLGLAVRGRA